MSAETQEFWDEQAADFDDEADHGLRDPAVRAAWAGLLLPLLPPAPSRVADLGCGTGSLSVLVAGAGHDVLGVDLSPAMIALARTKAAAAGLAVGLAVGDAARPPLAPGSLDVVVARHVLWAFDDPAAALARWVDLLAPGGRLLLVEGRWSTGAGISAEDCRRLVLGVREQADVRSLPDAAFWGKEITDERYLVSSSR